MGFVKKAFQKGSIDEALKNSLWNVTYLTLWRTCRGSHTDATWQGELLITIWSEHFNLPADDMHRFDASAVVQVKNRYMSDDWIAVYDFIEFIANADLPGDHSQQLIRGYNSVLEKHVSAYRPRWTSENRPYVDTSKPANGTNPGQR